MKKVFMVVMCIALITVNFSACSKDNAEAEGKFNTDYKVDQINDNVTDANTRFAFDIFKKLNDDDANKNIFISPFSISTALTMTYNGAKADTAAAMAKTLGYSGMKLDTVNESYMNLIGYLDDVDEKIKLDIANSIWIRKGENIKQDFIDRNTNYFNSWVESLDFSKDSAAETINNWIAKSTKDKIKKMITPPIPASVVMYLINAIYFKGDWTTEFDVEKTFDTDFTSGKGEEQQIKMMNRKDKMDYARGDDYRAVRLPYGNGKTAMYCVLPEDGDDINEFIGQMNADKWKEIRQSLDETEDVILQIPRFEMEYGIKKLNDSLKSLGMETAFSQGADFSGMREGLFISKVLHKAVIEVNEQGSEAAGATVVVMDETTALDPPAFIGNRPFLFLIAEEDTGTILFMGKLFEME